MTFKKSFLVLFLAVFALGLVFAAGGRQDTRPMTTSDGRTIIRAGMQAHPFVTDYDDNYFTNFMENLHNIEIEFILMPTDGNELRTRISLETASGEMPDVYMLDTSLSPEALLDYGSKGAFRALNDYLNNPALAPNWARVLPRDREPMLNSMTQADGNIYSLANFEPEIWNETPNRYYINQVWLDNLGLQRPTTTDELRNVLIAFRDRDPNRTGRRESIGVYGRFDGGYGENTIASLLNSFLFYHPNRLGLDNTGTRVVAPFTDPAFRRGLQYLNGLYRDGMLAASIFTDDQTQFRAVLNTFPNIVGILSVGSLSHWANQRENPSFAEMHMIPPMAGPEGVKYTPYQPYFPAQRGIVTSRARAPETAFKLLESFFDVEIGLIARFGEEGVDWFRTPEELARTSNALVSMGIIPALTMSQNGIIWNEPSNKFWRNNNPRYAPEEVANSIGNRLNPFDPNDRISMGAAYNYMWYRGLYPEHVLPQLKFTIDEAMNVSQNITTINEYVRQAIAEFVTSARDINNDAAWNSYINDLGRMGLQQWITTSQAAFDRTRR